VERASIPVSAQGYLAIVLHALCPSCGTRSTAASSRSAGSTRRSSSATCRCLDAFDRLGGEGVPFALTMSVTRHRGDAEGSLLGTRFEGHLTRLEAPRLRPRDQAPQGDTSSPPSPRSIARSSAHPGDPGSSPR